MQRNTRTGDETHAGHIADRDAGAGDLGISGGTLGEDGARVRDGDIPERIQRAGAAYPTPAADPHLKGNAHR